MISDKRITLSVPEKELAKNIDIMIKNNLPSTLVGYLSQIHTATTFNGPDTSINTPINVSDCKNREPDVSDLDFKESIGILRNNYSDIGINNNSIYDLVPYSYRYKIINFLGNYIIGLIQNIRHKLKMVRNDVPKIVEDESELKLFNSYCALIESYWKMIKRYTDTQGRVDYEKVLWSKGKIGNKQLCFYTAPMYIGNTQINIINNLYTRAMSKDFAW